MFTVYRKELRSYFNNMIGAVVTAFLLLVIGILATILNIYSLSPQLEYSLGMASFAFMLIIPLLTMRSISEEKRQRTDTLLYSLPLTSWQIVLGKYLAMVTILLIPIAVMSVYPMIFAIYGTVSFASTYASIFGFFCFGASLIAIGLLISSLTENQVIAGVISAAAILVCFLIDTIAALIPAGAIYSFLAFTVVIVAFGLICYLMTKNAYVASGISVAAEVVMLIVYLNARSLFEGAASGLLRWFSLYDRMYYFTVGIFDLRSVIFFVTVTFLFLYLTVTALEKKRWS